MTPVASLEHETLSDLTARVADRVSRHPLAAGLASGFLLWTTFPPVEWHWLAWIALAPLFWLATVREKPLKAYTGAWLGGLLFWVLAVEWLRMIATGAWLGWLALALVFSVWWPAFLALTRWAVFRLGIPLILAAPIVWVGLEYARAYFLSGFPWFYTAHSQFRQIYLIQIADVTGALGVSLLIAIVNALLVDFATLPLLHKSKNGTRLFARQNVRLCAVTVLLGTTLCYGAFRVSSARFGNGPRLALLQSNIEQKHKSRGDAQPILAEFAGLIESAIARSEPPDLLIWPETAYPHGFISLDSTIDPQVFEKQVRSLTDKLSAQEWIERAGLIAAELHRWTDSAQVPMLVGTTFYNHTQASIEKYNSAILFTPDDPAIHCYHKMHLVPFGEYFPLFERFPWLVALTPYRGEKVQSLNVGRDPLKIPFGPYQLAVSICFEDTIPQVIRRSFLPAGNGQPPDVLINLSNDGWFHGSAELDIHLAIGVFRAVEHRVPLARAVNTGLSALVDGNGEIRETLPKESKGVLSVTVPLDDRTSSYSRWGDWLGLSCLAATIGWLPLGFFRKRRSSDKRN